MAHAHTAATSPIRVPSSTAGNVGPIAVFLATSGHSGVDRVMTNLIHEFAARGLAVDLLHIRNHGPYLQPVAGVRIVDLGTAHVNSSLPALMRYLRRERPVALLSDKDRVNRLALCARRLTGVPTRVVVRTGTTVSQDLQALGTIARWSQRLSMRWFYPWADAIVVPSHAAAHDLAQLNGWPPGRVQALPSPVVTPQLAHLAEQPLDHHWFKTKDRPIILGVGELGGRKDFSTLVRAFAKVRQRRRCRLLILGEGRQREKLQRLAANLEVSDDLSLPGFVKNPYAYMARADLFVLCSRYEGSPVALMEALAVGVPVVSTDCPSGPREILQDGRYGRLVPVGDVNALADAVLATLDRPPARTFLQQAATPFTVETSATKYLEALGIGPPAVDA
jgi:glycosyltransferase involved in cell wall biosynthesis